MDIEDNPLKLNPATIRDIRPQVLDDDGRMRVLPASFWAETTVKQRALFGHLTGIYSFPTVELVEHLRDKIGRRKAIEIGAGNGVLAEALDIPATDSFQQNKREYREHYAQIKHATVPYGPNVQELDARQAVRRHRPEVVIACWVTWKWDRHQPWRAGNEAGVDELAILEAVGEYILVGNEKLHRRSRLWEHTFEIEYPNFVFSRAHNGSREFIATFRR